MFRKVAESFRQKSEWLKDPGDKDTPAVLKHKQGYLKTSNDNEANTLKMNTINGTAMKYLSISERLLKNYPTVDSRITNKSTPTLKSQVAEDGKNKKRNRKIVILEAIPRQVTIEHLLDKVGGGPLESVFTNYKNNRFANNVTSCEIHFLDAKDAQDFFKFANTPNSFVVLGSNIKAKWATESNSDSYTTDNLKNISNSLWNEINNWGARRSITFNKEIEKFNVKEKSLQLVYKLSENRTFASPKKKAQFPNALNQYNNFIDIIRIREEISSFGEIIDILPSLSRKVSFTVIFSDVRSAIVVKKTCETPNSALNIYFKGWKLWYAPDPTDRPCQQF